MQTTTIINYCTLCKVPFINNIHSDCITNSNSKKDYQLNPITKVFVVFSTHPIIFTKKEDAIYYKNEYSPNSIIEECEIDILSQFDKDVLNKSISN